MTAPLIPVEKAATMVEENVYYSVRDAIDICCIFDLEERLGHQFAAHGMRGDEILKSARGLMARAFRRLADECERGWIGFDDDDELRTAYLAAIQFEENGVAS